MFEKGGIVKRGLIFHDDLGDDRQGTLWNDVVQLDETFFQALRDHPVPLLEEAVRQMKALVQNPRRDPLFGQRLP